MKKNFLGRFLIALLAIALCCLHICAFASEMQFPFFDKRAVEDAVPAGTAESTSAGIDFQHPTGAFSQRIRPEEVKRITASDAARINASMEQYIPSEDTLVINRATSYYYYDHLDPVAKEIYDIMLMIARDPVTDQNYGVMMTDINPESDEYYYEMACATFALTYDHPELFWLYDSSETSIGYYSEMMSMNGLYLVYYGLTAPYTNYEAQMTAFNAAADAFLADINTNTSDYEIVKQIHDKLIDLVTYDDNVLAGGVAERKNLAHTAYGALVTNSQGVPNFAVCDGYSLAFEYLLQQCGIEAVVVAGDAGANVVTAGGHAWNLVKLNNNWYEVDSTWNDTGALEESVVPGIDYYEENKEALTDPDFLEKMRHAMFLISTEEIRNFDPGDEYRYYLRDGGYMSYLDKSVHIRWTYDGLPDPYQADPAVITLAPVATSSYQPPVF
ncbi:MAG: hypothetical protein IJA26_08260 [Clostridia bacterium]|nr:hypothetical protein [Clostridia bacterium]